MSKIKGTVVFDGAAAEPKGFETDTDVEFNSNEDGVLQSLRVGEKNYTIPQGSNDMFLTVYTTTTMNTSTLPSIQVPKLTADQIANVQTAMSQGKDVTIDASYNGVTNQFKVLESDHDGDVGGIRLVYYNYYLDYTNDDDFVIATYTKIGGGGGGGDVTSVNGKTGAVVLNATDIKLATTQTTVEQNFIRLDEEIAEKLDKVTSVSTKERVYGVTANGAQEMLPINTTDSNALLTKSQIDSTYIKAENATETSTANSIMARDGNGRTQVESPSANKDVANKQYVDNALAGLATVATSGNYNDLSNKPTIPTVNNGTLTIQKNGSVVATFGANQSGNATANISVPTALSELSADTTHRTVTDSEKTTWNGKQARLVSGTNLKTINGNSLLGSGDLTVGGGGAKIYKHELTWNTDEGYPRNTVCGYFRRSAQYTSMESFVGDAICITGFTRSGQPKNSGSWSYAATEALTFYEGSSTLFSVNIDSYAAPPDSYTVTEL